VLAALVMMVVYDGPLAGQQGQASYLAIDFFLGSLVVLSTASLGWA
jgi:hypothetical protein